MNSFTKTMRVLIPVFFNAPLGGLQSHVRAQVCALREEGHDVFVQLKPGPFAEILKGDKVSVLETDFANLKACVDQALNAGPFHLVHAHPFAARKVGLRVAQEYRVPFLVTFHGTYLDNLPAWRDSASLLIAVSDAIRDFLIREGGVAPARVVVIPNGVNTRLYRPRGSDEFCSQFPALSLDPCRQRIILASRLDEDKRLILDAIMDTWKQVIRTRSFTQDWWIAGDGTLRDDLEREADKLNRAAGRRIVHFLGWKDEPSLAILLSTADLAIAPGRCALEAMACATPVIAVGSKGYVGLIDESRFNDGIYGNFGGYGNQHGRLADHAMFRDIDTIIYDQDRLRRIGEKAAGLARAFFSQEHLDARLLAVYRTLCGHVSYPSEANRMDVTQPHWKFADLDNAGKLLPSWIQTGTEEQLAVSVEEDGTLRAAFKIGSDAKAYFTPGDARFNAPSPLAHEWRLEPDTDYVLSLTYNIISGNPSAKVWVIEYDAQKRLRHVTENLASGTNTLRWRSSEAAHSFRFALRFSGEGIVRVSPFRMENILRREMRKVHKRRTDSLPAYGAYEGENLLFIIGPPRSGTTWVLTTLQAHPQVSSATLDNLGVRMHAHATLETNVFNADRPFTDAQIKRKFHDLSLRHSGRVIVEKTPAHLFHTKRIRHVFPQAAIVLVCRDGRDVVTSLIHIGRDPDAWWKGAPNTIEKATILWVRYAQAALRCLKKHDPILFDYEKAVDEAVEQFTSLFNELGLDPAYASECVEASRNGKLVSIPGVFREGRKGSWRTFFTAEDVQTFKRIGGRELIELGYEKDDLWSVTKE